MLARWLASLARCPRPRALIASKGKARTPNTSTLPCPFLLPTRLQTRTRRMHSPINPDGSSHRLWRGQCGVVRCRATPKRVRALGGRYGWTSVELTLYARAAGGVYHATTREGYRRTSGRGTRCPLSCRITLTSPFYVSVRDHHYHPLALVPLAAVSSASPARTLSQSKPPPGRWRVAICPGQNSEVLRVFLRVCHLGGTRKFIFPPVILRRTSPLQAIPLSGHKVRTLAVSADGRHEERARRERTRHALSCLRNRGLPLHSHGTLSFEFWPGCRDGWV
ncbi:hypothetical protein C2E23DRAFT_291715 [Lenzites betulinus]|nr:hypothetical protein C2E23DRAFT_291715 [Lenzites betulinus]